tara:strand:+ start:249 stop:530 length:282 start_codon:yes stop_codon:yes gene_type:complete
MELKLIKEELEDLKRSRAIGTLTPYGCRYLKELNYVVDQLSLHLVILTPDAIAKHLEWDSYHHMMINEEHIDHQLKEAINMLFFTNKLEVPFG